MQNNMYQKNNIFLRFQNVNKSFYIFYNHIKKILEKVSIAFFSKWQIHLLLIAVLLGRAVILDVLAPFAIAYFAVMFYLRKDKVLLVSLSLIIGSSLSIIDNQTLFVFSGFLVFIIVHRWQPDLTYAPIIVALSIILPKAVFYIFIDVGQFYPWIMLIIEGILGFILTLIFVQAFPLILYKHTQVSLEQEEIIALTILLASIMTGTIGIVISGYSIENIISKYIVLIFSLVGGSPIGAAVGVVIGLILSLSYSNAVYQISLLAFSGLLAGLLKQANKIGVAIGFLLGTTILSIYMESQSEVINTLMETSFGMLAFMLTPKSFLRNMAKYIPGTNEYQNNYKSYVSQVKDITSKKIEKFANMFSQLSNSFQEISNTAKFEQSEQINHFINQIVKTQCQTCWKRKKCWEEDFFHTYCMVTELMTIIEGKRNFSKSDIPTEFKDQCVKNEQISFQLVDIYASYEEHLYWKKQLEESRYLVSNQLSGVSKVMKDFASEIKKEDKELRIQEEQIHKALEMLGLSIIQVNILKLEEGNVEIEIMQPSCQGKEKCIKIVAPLISEVIGENIIVKTKDCNFDEDGICKSCLRSAKNFEVDTGYAGAAKDGKWLSGDSFKTIEVGNGKFAVALSDGMGNGERAQKESKATLELLEQLLQTGFDITFSVKTINSILLLRSQEEIFSTIDLAIIDLFNGYTEFLKVGATPSFIKRGNEIFTVKANNLPIGIIQEIDIDSKDFELKEDDLLIMITDGIYDSPKHSPNKEVWMKRVIQEIETDSPQEFADLILEKIIRNKNGAINDDMTVIVSAIKKFNPEWAMNVPNISKIERKKA